MTIQELKRVCYIHGVRPAEVAQKFGYTRQWLYVDRKNPLPELVRLALLPAIEEIKGEQQ